LEREATILQASPKLSPQNAYAAVTSQLATFDHERFVASVSLFNEHARAASRQCRYG
jgi:hypothetical protein